MKAQYRIRSFTIEVEAETVKALFKLMAEVEEIFGSDQRCGCCRKANLHFRVRTIEDNDFYELVCADCSATLSLGQTKKGGSLFPKRKAADNKPLPNRGWQVYEGKKARKAGAGDDGFALTQPEPPPRAPSPPAPGLSRGVIGRRG